MTEDAAKLKKAVLNAQEPDWFCPLINKYCVKTCVCYNPAYIRQISKGGGPYFSGTVIVEWDAFKQYCGNQMFFRECSHQ